MDLLVALSLREGSLAIIICGCRRVVVRLRIHEEDYEEVVTISQQHNSSQVGISPMIAANLGIAWSHHSSSESVASITNEDCWLEACYLEPQVANHITLRPLGRPLHNIWPRFLLPETDETLPFPSTNLLTQQSHILSVYDWQLDLIYCYEILDIQGGNQAGESSESKSSSHSIFVTASSTQYQFDSSPLTQLQTGVRRLPPLWSLQQFYQANTPIDADTNQTLPQTGPPPHPNLHHVMNALFQPPHLAPHEQIIHVIGTNQDHDLKVCVEAAAHQIGMQCLSVRGLAAFAAHAGGHTVNTGSLPDQLAGLQAVFKWIRSKRLEPCVLHLYDFDEELSIGDELQRHEQENRFWAAFIEALEGYRHRPSPRTCYKVQDDIMAWATPLLVVISTKAPLEPGPLLQKLVFPSISLEFPDRAYAKYLWKNDDFFDDHVADLLKGRTARDIVCLRQQLLQREVPVLVGELSTALKGLVQELDVTRRKKSSTAVRISNVRWEDVGGLAYVRTEIMDAIELPLKHPHLFPKGGGRSGILLYGEHGDRHATSVLLYCVIRFSHTTFD
jgi:hypothetical protein